MASDRKAYHAAYNLAHRAEANARCKAYRARHPERVKASAAAWDKAHPGKMQEWKTASAKKWKKENPARVREHDAARRALEIMAMPPWADRAAIAEVYAAAAARTRESGIQHHVDHAYPLRGQGFSGLHVPWNLQVLTAAQNMSKGNRLGAPR